MLLRVTAQSALPAVRQLSHDLGKWLDEAGNLAPSAGFRESLERLNRAIEARQLGFECTPQGSPVEAITAALQPVTLDASGSVVSLKAGIRSFQVYLQPLDPLQPRTCRVGELQAPVLFFGPIAGNEEELTCIAESFLSERPVAIFRGTAEEGTRWMHSGMWYFEVSDGEDGLEHSLLRRLKQAEGQDLLEVLLAVSAADGLDSLSGGLEKALDQELRGLKARKAITMQRVTRSQQRGMPSNNELQAELRQRFQRHQTDFGRGIEDRLQVLLTPQTGKLSKLVEEKLETLQDLDHVHKSKTVSVEIPEDFQRGLLEEVRSELYLQFRSDIVAERDLFGVVSKEVESYLTNKGGPPVVPQFQFLGEDRIQRLFESSLVVQRRYSGEMPKTGVFEYAMAARRPLTLLLMLLSNFGFLIYFRRSLVVMLPVSFLLLVIGGLLAVRSSRREHQDLVERELERARELLRGEFRRALSDLQRSWPGILCEHLAEQFQILQQQVDGAMREHQTTQVNEAGEEKQRIQRQLQILENTEKKLMMTAKGRELVGKAISQIKGELKQLLMTLIRQPATAPE